MYTTTIQDLIARNEQYSHKHKPFLTFKETIETKTPTPRTVIICCADFRSNPDHFLQLKEDAVIIRTPGGKAENCLEGLLAVDSLLHFENVMIIQHTDCGATVYRNDKIKAELLDRAPAYVQEILSFDFRPILGTIEESVRNSVKFLMASPYLRPELKKSISGFVFDIQTGRINPV